MAETRSSRASAFLNSGKSSLPHAAMKPFTVTSYTQTNIGSPDLSLERVLAFPIRRWGGPNATIPHPGMELRTTGLFYLPSWNNSMTPSCQPPPHTPPYRHIPNQHCSPTMQGKWRVPGRSKDRKEEDEEKNKDQHKRSRSCKVHTSSI